MAASSLLIGYLPAEHSSRSRSSPRVTLELLERTTVWT
jgi:hypothetical protein